jgi:hypothetical protein
MTTTPHTHEKPGLPWNYIKYFAAALAVFCLGHWLGTLALRGVEHSVPAFQKWPLLLSAVSLALLIAFSLLVRHAHHTCPRPQNWRDRSIQFCLAVGVLISAFFVAASVEHWLEHGPLHLGQHTLFFSLTCFLFLILAERLFRRLQQDLERPRDIRPLLHLRQEAAKPLEAMILFISPPNQAFELTPDQGGSHAVVKFTHSGDCLLHGAGHLEADILELSREMKEREYWNWQQLLRALRGHSQLRQVLLIGSVGEKGSHQHLEACKAFLRPYLPEHCAITHETPPLNFVRFNDLVDALRHLILKVLKTMPKSSIVIDVTGGTATASIAGAATTMNLDCVFQYVDTNKPNETLTYDVLHEHGPHMH